MRMVATELWLTTIADDRGTLVTVDMQELGLPMQRMFQIRDVPPGSTRGGHAHRACHQVLIASAGIIDIELHDGVQGRILRLQDPARALHVPPGMWTSQTYVTSGAMLTVLASHPYSEADYIRDFAEFLEMVDAKA